MGFQWPDSPYNILQKGNDFCNAFPLIHTTIFFGQMKLSHPIEPNLEGEMVEICAQNIIKYFGNANIKFIRKLNRNHFIYANISTKDKNTAYRLVKARSGYYRVLVSSACYTSGTVTLLILSSHSLQPPVGGHIVDIFLQKMIKYLNNTKITLSIRYKL